MEELSTKEQIKERIDDEIIFESVKNELEKDIKEFIKAIKLELKDENGNNKHSKPKWGSQKDSRS